MVDPLLGCAQLVELLGDLLLLPSVGLVIVGILVDVDDSRGQGTLGLLGDATTTGVAIEAVLGVDQLRLARELLLLGHLFYVAPVEHPEHPRLLSRRALGLLTIAGLALCLAVPIGVVGLAGSSRGARRAVVLLGP